jgi:hypothetical protein
MIVRGDVVEVDLRDLIVMWRDIGTRYSGEEMATELVEEILDRFRRGETEVVVRRSDRPGR